MKYRWSLIITHSADTPEHFMFQSVLARLSWCTICQRIQHGVIFFLFFFLNSLNCLSTPAICYVLAGLMGAHFPPLLMMDELAQFFCIWNSNKTSLLMLKTNTDFSLQISTAKYCYKMMLSMLSLLFLFTYLHVKWIVMHEVISVFFFLLQNNTAVIHYSVVLIAL